ncbi:unnamed protein product [Paramecium sonneborni]|uniref:Uncharacterized protein n=1 Tax=Paramecium sonneborni TaxID=65129 RepID=A0A8S1PE90_9CILI|nr:unnamed protein product [Paramecium sonneborni]
MNNQFQFIQKTEGYRNKKLIREKFQFLKYLCIKNSNEGFGYFLSEDSIKLNREKSRLKYQVNNIIYECLFLSNCYENYHIIQSVNKIVQQKFIDQIKYLNLFLLQQYCKNKRKEQLYKR